MYNSFSSRTTRLPLCWQLGTEKTGSTKALACLCCGKKCCTERLSYNILTFFSPPNNEGNIYGGPSSKGAVIQPPCECLHLAINQKNVMGETLSRKWCRGFPTPPPPPPPPSSDLQTIAQIVIHQKNKTTVSLNTIDISQHCFMYGREEISVGAWRHGLWS